MREEIIVDESVLFWAFRYALGRSSYSVTDVTSAIDANWDMLPRHTQLRIKQDISKALVNNDAGMPCDAKEWGKLLRLGMRDDVARGDGRG